ncbi:Rhs family protein [Pseudomonas syringae pv. apii]|nr:Rhs family protein [Pseudomonas syringae pv. apii]
MISDMERDDLHREIYRTQGKLTSCFGYDSIGRKAWQYATTLPAEKLSQIHNPLIKPERYVEHAYNSIHRRYEYDPAGELSRTLDKLRGETRYEYEAKGQLLARINGLIVDGEEFRYDAAANRLNFNTSRFDHVKDNRLKQWRNHEYKYESKARATRNASSGKACACCAKKVRARAACTSTNPAAMRRWPVLINAKAKPKTRFTTTTPTRSAHRWK